MCQKLQAESRMLLDDLKASSMMSEFFNAAMDSGSSLDELSFGCYNCGRKERKLDGI